MIFIFTRFLKGGEPRDLNDIQHSFIYVVVGRDAKACLHMARYVVYVNLIRSIKKGTG